MGNCSSDSYAKETEVLFQRLHRLGTKSGEGRKLLWRYLFRLEYGAKVPRHELSKHLGVLKLSSRELQAQLEQYQLIMPLTLMKTLRLQDRNN